MEKKEKNTGTGKVIRGIAIALFVLVLFIIAFAIYLYLLTGPAPEDDATEASTANEYVMENEVMFAKYGNFKNYESASSIIISSMEDSGRTDIEHEIFDYWFTLVRYGDYEDAYSFIDNESIVTYGIAYDFDDFTQDCARIRIGNSEDANVRLQAEILENNMLSMMNDANLGDVHMAVISSDTVESVLYFPFYITKDYHIIPFELGMESPYQRYGSIESGIDENYEDTEENTENTENTSEQVSNEDSNVTGDSMDNTIDSSEDEMATPQ